jgi:hypothetical protein
MLKKAIKYLPFVLIIVFLAVTVVYAQGGDTGIIHSCVDKSGKIRIVAATTPCEKSEAPLSWNIQGPPGPGGSGQLVVVDSEGHELGVLIYGSDVAHYIGPFWINLSVAPSEIAQTMGWENLPFPSYPPPSSMIVSYFTVYYESGDCTGTPYLEGWSLTRQAYVSGTTAFYPANPYEVRTFHSSQGAKWGIEPVTPGPCLSAPRTALSGPIGEFDISGFIPPFSIRPEP